LVHGSGPQDRDETIGPSKPFRDLAGGLASRGVAVLRYEKRTKAHAAKLAEGQEGLTVHEETVEDAILAADLLRATAGIDPDRVYVLGHSLGGMLIPRIAAGASEAAGFVIMAGTTRGLAEVTIEQLDYILSLKNEAEFSELERTQIETMKAEAQRVRELDASAEEQPDGLLFGAPASYWLDLRAYDPAGMVKDVKRPLLVLQGGRDYQVTEVDFDNWRAALAGRDDVTFRLYPDLNHIFATGEGMATPEEYGEPAHVAEEVINDIADWIANHG
jgi:dienelactone hydrolase